MSSTTSALTSSTLAPSSAPSVTPTPPPQSGPQNSPLLFFVALGFGVVFTNLWIIVGVKYCFRYNARNRARQQDENGEPIDLAAMPQHRRRRREKKLLTMDEVNERFPISKYKTWVAERAARGLPTEGGVSQSRAASIKDAEGVVAPINTSAGEGNSKKSEEIAEPHRDSHAADSSAPTGAQPSAETSTFNQTASTLPEIKLVSSFAASHAETEDEEAIPPAVPGASEMLSAPGDSCAICIDALENDDDVRGLTCGHAFHASCLDPWLTSRRACCPLCKADYYVPKPRPENADVSDPSATGDAAAAAQPGAAVIARPGPAAAPPATGLSRYLPRLTGRVEPATARRRAEAQRQNSEPQTTRAAFAQMFSRGNNGQSNATTAQPTSQPSAADSEQTEGRRWRPSMPNWPRRGAQTQQTTTPGQLEAANIST